MYPVDMPSYTSPARSYFTRPLPPGSNPFADKPTLRGTNSDSGIINTSTFIGRRPAPPSLVPSHEKIPYRPPDLPSGAVANGANNNNNNNKPQQPNWSLPRAPDVTNQQINNDYQRKKVLNTPAQKPPYHKINNVNDGGNVSDNASNKNIFHFPSISRILSGSNGRKEDIPEVLLRTVTARPSFMPSAAESSVSPSQSQPNDAKNPEDNDKSRDSQDHDDEDDYEQSNNGNRHLEEDINSEEENSNRNEPKTQPKIKEDVSASPNANGNNKLSTESPAQQSDVVYSTQIIQNLAATNSDRTKFKQNASGDSKQNNQQSSSSAQQPTVATWSVAWNIHVYLSAVLFTVLAVYSIFKMIFYDKLTHLVSQNYFICLHLTLIIICLSRIFFLCYDAYNIDNSFNLFLSEILLNLPATLLTIAFAVLILFLLLRSLNHKTNRYSALMRPLTVTVGSSVHILLCVTLHYVESYGQKQRNQQIYYQQLQRANVGYRNYVYNAPPRVLSLICQIIYIFVCFSLGCFYLHIYKVLKRVLRNKSQNYIHGYQNLSYAIHITIATALLFILLAALQIYGAISISTTRPLISSLTEIDWLQWGYQFSLRLIEIAIIALLSWVTGLKTGASKVLQREKGMEQHNVSGFALFPCTSTSSQEHFETDYPAICNANTNLHTYTLRTGKPIYDDTFALNSLGMENPIHPGTHGRNMGASGTIQSHHHHHGHHDGGHHIIAKNGREFQIQSSLNDFPPRNGGGSIYDTNSGRSSVIAQHNSGAGISSASTITDDRNEYVGENGAMADHYENPNFELKTSNDGNSVGRHHHSHHQQHHPQDIILDNSYAAPLTNDVLGQMDNYNSPVEEGYDFQKFERPSFADRPMMAAGNCSTEFRASKNLKALIKSNSNDQQQSKQNNLSGSQQQSNSAYNHHPSQLSNPANNYNSFDRRGGSGIRKSGTLNNIGSGNGQGSGRNSTTASTSNINAVPGRSQTALRSLNNIRQQHDFQSQNNNMIHRSTTGRASGNNVSSKKDRQNNQLLPQRSNTSHMLSSTSTGGMAATNDINEYDDTIIFDSSDGVHAAAFYQPDAAMFKSQRSIDYAPSVHQPSNGSGSGSGESATSGSMLVAENGFVRFRPLDELNGGGSGSSSGNGDNNIISMHSPTMHKSSAGNGRHKERSYTNS